MEKKCITFVILAVVYGHKTIYKKCKEDKKISLNNLFKLIRH